MCLKLQERKLCENVILLICNLRDEESIRGIGYIEKEILKTLGNSKMYSQGSISVALFV